MSGLQSRATDDTAQLRRLESFYGLELLTAQYSRHVFPRHYHDTFMIEVVEQGADEFFCQGAMHTAPAGSVIVINPHDVHTGRSAAAVPLHYRSMYPVVQLICDIAEQIDDHTPSVPHFRTPVIEDQQLAQALHRAHRALEQPESQLEAGCLVTQALGYLIQHYADQRPHRRAAGYEQTALRRVKAHLADHLADDVSLDQLAQTVGYSPFHLIRMFRTATGLAPYEYLTNLRITRAKQLLTKQSSIATVAASLGFYDQSHLNRHFKRIVGVTPGDYAREMATTTYSTATHSPSLADPLM